MSFIYVEFRADLPGLPEDNIEELLSIIMKGGHRYFVADPIVSSIILF